jgi:hypothetical protein
MPDSREDEVQHAALFKKDRRAVKTLMLSDIAVVMADQGFCEITDTAKEGYMTIEPAIIAIFACLIAVACAIWMWKD